MLVGAIVPITIVVGCSTTGTSNGASANDGGPSVSSSGSPDAGTASSGLSCLGVLKCAGSCPDEDADACVQACLDQTRVSSQPVTTAFAKCIEDNQCADATCIQTKCESELSACITDDASEVDGKPSSAPTPTGSVPAALVGGWNHLDSSLGSTYEFKADGATTQLFDLATNYYCDDAISVSSTGVTTVTGDSLVYHRVEGTQVIKTCGKPSSKAVGPADIGYRYALGTFDDGHPKLSLSRVNDDGTISAPLEFHLAE